MFHTLYMLDIYQWCNSSIRALSFLISCIYLLPVSQSDSSYSSKFELFNQDSSYYLFLWLKLDFCHVCLAGLMWVRKIKSRYKIKEVRFLPPLVMVQWKIKLASKLKQRKRLIYYKSSGPLFVYEWLLSWTVNCWRFQLLWFLTYQRWLCHQGVLLHKKLCINLNGSLPLSLEFE